MQSNLIILQWSNGTPWLIENHRINIIRILVARHYRICQSLHARMCDMPNYKDKTTNQSTNQTKWKSWRNMENNHHGLYHRPPSILTVIDYHSKAIILSPCHKTITAEQTSQLLIDNIWKCMGFPMAIILDWGPQFTAQVTQEFWRKLGIKQKLSTAFHPQTNRVSE